MAPKNQRSWLTATLLDAKPRSAGYHILPRHRHHGSLLDAAPDRPRPPRQPRPVRHHRATGALLAVKPPVFDNPITTGFVYDQTGVLFSSDCFGALLQAVPSTAADLDTDLLQAGQVCSATIDSPWVHAVDRGAFSRALDQLRALEPTMVCRATSPAPGAMLDVFVDSLALVPDPKPFVGPDQAALEAMLAGLAHPS